MKLKQILWKRKSTFISVALLLLLECYHDICDNDLLILSK